ncbi:MAG: 5'-methylthioadenosine/adenosylhomocysteine nucleosidase [Clostridia bacterium]|nr:5'-methylthioadenosine/adenosylhomocysteine nucleosidase [Clostridia bacterium]
MSKLIGIIGAMDIEVDGLVSSMTNASVKEISGIKFYSGKIGDREVVVAKCGIGKVFASICTQAMIMEYHPDAIINSGVAGTLSSELGVLDVAIAKNVVQHDMDTSAIGDPKGLISGINVIYIDASSEVIKALENACKKLECKSKTGTIASGDKFISQKADKDFIKNEFSAIACEMEGASVGHVCYVNNIPFGIIRTISDGEGAEMDYQAFASLAAKQSIEIVKKFIELY